MSTDELSITCVPTSGAVDTRELESLVLELKTEIEAAPTSGFQISETQGKNEGALGPEWLPILTAIVSSQVAVEITKGIITTIRDWLRRRKPVEVTIKGPKGEYTITGSQLSSTEIERISEKVVRG
jgi:hypothetical protein